MATLTGEQIASTYTTLLQIATALDATLRNVEDGVGTVSALQLSTAAAAVDGDVYITSGL